MEAEEVQFCKNCKRDVSATNYVIHSVHCERKIKLCDRCLEPVPRNEIEKHEEEFHSKDICPECGISVEKWRIEKHKETCIRRLVPCEYCKLEVPFVDFSEHSIPCESRTEQCSNCNKHVMIKAWELHQTNCSERDAFVRKLVPCEYCELEIPLPSLLEHSAACGSRTELCSKCNKYIMIKDLEKHHTNCWRRETEAAPCEFCGLQIDWGEIMEHTAMCGARTEECLSCNRRVMLKHRDSHFTTCEKMLNFNESIPCEYCGGTFNNNSIGIHVEFCNSRTKKCNKCNQYIQRKDMELHYIICEKKEEPRLEVPCKYCGGLFPKDFLEDHTNVCGTRLQKCEKCDVYITLKKFGTHSDVCKERTSKTNGNCPVCHQSIPLVEMNVHMAYCAQVFYGTSENENQNKLNEFTFKKDAGELAVKHFEEEIPQGYLEDVAICPSCKCKIPEERYNQHLFLCYNEEALCHFCYNTILKRNEKLHFQSCPIVQQFVVKDKNSEKFYL